MNPLHRHRLLWSGLVPAMLLGACADLVPPAGPAARQFVALHGAEARAFVPPAQLRPAAPPWELAGTRIERLQQYVGEAAVLGGQLTVQRDPSGAVVAVVGAHYPDLQPINQRRLSRAEAEQLAADRLPEAEQRRAQLKLDPRSRRLFYSVDSIGVDWRRRDRIDAETGALLASIDSLTDGCSAVPAGIGMFGDEKDLRGLVSQDSSGYSLRTAGLTTRDLGSQKKPFYGTADLDADGCYDAHVADRRASPDHGALVDAHFYADLTRDYYLGAHGYDWVSGAIAHTGGGVREMLLWAHYDVNYVNAFWNGLRATFGDGDGVRYREFTTLDVVVHELSHAVTEFNSNLVYQGESGALNEAFSDIMAAAAGHASGLDTGWDVGEGVTLDGDGLRNMADPAEDGDPAHYAERYTGTGDNGGVHINSGIVNHAFYLLAMGGSNASGLSSEQVSGIGVAAAADLFFRGFVALTETSDFCDARLATQAVAGAHASNVASAWIAVGVDDALCGIAPPPPPCAAASDCDDGNSCTTDLCEAGACVHRALADDSACAGSGICCAGSCVAAACDDATACDDGDACTDDSCTAAGTCAAACAFTPSTAPACQVQGDTLTILKASYNSRKDQLSVEASSSAAPDASLTLFYSSDGGQSFSAGQAMDWSSRKGKYSATLSPGVSPDRVRVESSEGGVAEASL